VTERLKYFAPCPRGVEPLLADELRRLGISGVRPQRAGVLFGGPLIHGYRALLWSRLASRVLLFLTEAPAGSADALYEAVRELPWEDHVAAEGTIAVDATGVNDALRNTQFTAVRIKDAIVDRFRDRAGVRPSVDTSDPDLRINVAIRADKATISLDLSGDPLHRRGYREPGVQVAAPMKETLAAAVLEIAGWRDIAASGGAFLDPMCGSGTLAIEAAMIASDVAPGSMRARWGFDRWLGHDADAWGRLLDAADSRAHRGLESLPPIAASDADSRAVDVAASFVRRAGLSGRVALSTLDFSAIRDPRTADTGLVAVNPPYGERLEQRSALPALYGRFGQWLRNELDGWTLATISSDTGIARGLGMSPDKVHELFNGRIPAPVSVYSISTAQAIGAAPDEAAFSARLTKMARHVGKWARRADVGCYRVYDADLPDYNVAIDVYTGAGSDAGKRWVHIAEYAAPSEVDAERATSRLATVLAVVPESLEVDPSDVFLKRRERQRGTAQYERVSKRSVTGTVAENGLLFEVNLSDYLDTGLFLDHRDTRAWVGELAARKRFLNLFAYTGSASVYAAAGGATATTTVDLSATYLEWAARNMALNGLDGAAHERVRADVVGWLAAARDAGHRYDLVFCDPPTFSNSKRMDATWDVQRDHVSLVLGIAELLADGGEIVFSCNRRKFAMDVAALAEASLDARDVTKRTIPKDFERRPGVHSCWTIRRA